MKYIRPSGLEIELEDTPEIAKFAESQGWKKAEKRKRRNKAEMEADRAKMETDTE